MCLKLYFRKIIQQPLRPFLMSHFIVGNYFCGLFDDVHAVHIFVLAHLLKESIHFFYDPKKIRSNLSLRTYIVDKRVVIGLIISVPALDLLYTLVHISDRSGPAIGFLGTARKQLKNGILGKFFRFCQIFGIFDDFSKFHSEKSSKFAKNEGKPCST